jgi:hypothetical protein
MFKIDAVSIGLPADATAEQIVAKVHGLGSENSELKERNDTLVKMLADAQAEAAAGRQAQTELTKAEGRRIVERASDQQIIDKADVEYWVSSYEKDPAGVKKYIEDHRYRQLLSAQTSLKGVRTVALDPEAEVSALALQKMAGNKKLTEAEAKFEVLREQPELAERRREALFAGKKDGG